jgi:hypothetical protein
VISDPGAMTSSGGAPEASPRLPGDREKRASVLEVCLLRAVTVVAQTDRLSDLVQQLRLSRLAVDRIRMRSQVDRLFDAPCGPPGPCSLRPGVTSPDTAGRQKPTGEGGLIGSASPC